MSTKTVRIEIRVVPFHLRRGGGTATWDVLGGWNVTSTEPPHVDGKTVREFPTLRLSRRAKGDKYPTAKKRAVAYARELGRKAWEAGYPSQVTICGRNGRIQTEHTYGRDPARTEG